MTRQNELRRVLTIGGSDSAGGAGIQADVKTGTALGVDVATVISAITAQNSLGVQALEPVSLDMFRTQISSVSSDIPVHAVKLGMLYDELRVRLVIDAIRQFEWDNIVCDPVLVSTSGTPVLDQDGLKVLVSALPLFTLLTPNVPEVVAMTGKIVATESDLIEAGHALMDLGTRAVLLKGGHLNGDKSTDILLQKGISEPTYFSSRRVHTRNDHGTGCALATAIASGLATGIDLPKAVSKGREFVQGALRRSIHLRNGSGRGSMDLRSACAHRDRFA
jgi:hydroxymethylpyrimidine/phosphomethylpyrimidine kinase